MKTILQRQSSRVYHKLVKAKKNLILSFAPSLNPIDHDGKIFLYHGNLYEHEKQFAHPDFFGLALSRITNRDIQINQDGSFPLPDGIADAFQSQDVMEHIHTSHVVFALNEIYRVLKVGGFFRLSVPDYRSPLLLRRTIFNYKGEAMGDAAMGAVAFTADLNSGLQIKHSFPEGDNHLWLPVYESVKAFLSQSLFSASQINFLHFIDSDGNSHTADIPFDDIFHVQRVPPNDMRAAGLPISIVVDIIKV